MMPWLQQLRHWLSSACVFPFAWASVLACAASFFSRPYVDFIKLLGLSKQEGSMCRDQLGCLEESVFLQGASKQRWTSDLKRTCALHTCQCVHIAIESTTPPSLLYFYGW